MKIHLLSDLHLEFAAFEPDREAANASDVVVLAGDIDTGTRGIQWARKAFEDKEIVYVAGNHEFYRGHWDEHLATLREQATVWGVHFLENYHVDIQGFRFLGCTLWTDFRFHPARGLTGVVRACEKDVSDFKEIRADSLSSSASSNVRLSARHVIARHKASVSWLRQQLERCNAHGLRPAVITHHTPTARSVAARERHDDLTATVASHLDDLLPRARLWIHGHVHESHDYEIGADGQSTRVVCNPRGYPTGRDARAFQNATFNPSLIIEI